MTLEPLHPRTFDSTSPVTAYWLTRCEGFRVVGRRKPSRVERALYDADPHRPVALRVRRERGTALIAIEMVEGVDPMQRVLYLRRPKSAALRAASRVSALGPHSRRAARRTVLSVATAWKLGAPRVSASARAGAGAASRRWPAMRRALATLGRGALQLAQAAVLLVAWGMVICAGVVRMSVRTCVRAIRRLVPHGARLACGSYAAARRALR